MTGPSRIAVLSAAASAGSWTLRRRLSHPWRSSQRQTLRRRARRCGWQLAEVHRPRERFAGHDLGQRRAPRAVEEDMRLVKDRAVLRKEQRKRVIANASPRLPNDR